MELLLWKCNKQQSILMFKVICDSIRHFVLTGVLYIHACLKVIDWNLNFPWEQWSLWTLVNFLSMHFIAMIVESRKHGRGWLAFGERNSHPQPLMRANICKFSQQKLCFTIASKLVVLDVKLSESKMTFVESSTILLKRA